MKELIERLRKSRTPGFPGVFDEAADALEQQAKQIEELKAEVTEQARLNGMGSEREAAKDARIEELEACCAANKETMLRDAETIEELTAALAVKDEALESCGVSETDGQDYYNRHLVSKALSLQPHASLVAKIKADAVEEYIANESNKADERGFVYRLREYLSYDPETGVVTRKKDKYRAKAGSVVGHHDADGYLQMSFDNKTIKLHRIVWALHYGYMPEEVDHINRVRDDNRLSNLREVSRSQNLRNVSPRGQTGMVGVFKDGNRFKAQICENNIRRHLGCFETANEASDAYQAAAAKHYADRIERGEVK